MTDLCIEMGKMLIDMATENIKYLSSIERVMKSVFERVKKRRDLLGMIHEQMIKASSLYIMSPERYDFLVSLLEAKNIKVVDYFTLKWEREKRDFTISYDQSHNLTTIDGWIRIKEYKDTMSISTNTCLHEWLKIVSDKLEALDYDAVALSNWYVKMIKEMIVILSEAVAKANEADLGVNLFKFRDELTELLREELYPIYEYVLDKYSENVGTVGESLWAWFADALSRLLGYDDGLHRVCVSIVGCFVNIMYYYRDRYEVLIHLDDTGVSVSFVTLAIYKGERDWLIDFLRKRLPLLNVELDRGLDELRKYKDMVGKIAETNPELII